METLVLLTLVMVPQEAVAAEVVLMAIKVTMAMLLCLMADMAITEAMELPKQAVVVAEELLPQEPVAIAKKVVVAETVDMWVNSEITLAVAELVALGRGTGQPEED
jgi:hypothetical protein